MHTPRTAFQGAPLGRAALWLGLVVWTVAMLRTPLPQLGRSFFHLIDLVFHEAGHVYSFFLLRSSFSSNYT